MFILHVSEKRDKKRRDRRTPTNKDVHSFSLQSLIRGGESSVAVIRSDSCSHQVPKPPTVSPQGQKQEHRPKAVTHGCMKEGNKQKTDVDDARSEGCAAQGELGTRARFI